MRKLFFLILMVATVPSKAQLHPLKAGDKMPNLEIHSTANYSGEVTKLYQLLNGKPTILNFWAGLMEREKYEEMQRLLAKFGPRLQIIIIALRYKEHQVLEFLKDSLPGDGAKIPIVRVLEDLPVWMDLFRDLLVPTAYVVYINPDGTIKAFSPKDESEIAETEVRLFMKDK